MRRISAHIGLIISGMLLLLPRVFSENAPLPEQTKNQTEPVPFNIYRFFGNSLIGTKMPGLLHQFDNFNPNDGKIYSARLFIDIQKQQITSLYYSTDVAQQLANLQEGKDIEVSSPYAGFASRDGKLYQFAPEKRSWIECGIGNKVPAPGLEYILTSQLPSHITTGASSEIRDRLSDIANRTPNVMAKGQAFAIQFGSLKADLLVTDGGLLRQVTVEDNGLVLLRGKTTPYSGSMPDISVNEKSANSVDPLTAALYKGLGGKEGFGFYIIFDKDNKKVVGNVLRGGPADKAGLSVQDTIMKIEGLDAQSLTTEELLRIVRDRSEIFLSLVSIKGEPKSVRLKKASLDLN